MHRNNTHSLPVFGVAAAFKEAQQYVVLHLFFMPKVAWDFFRL
jgi:hypothetical protein